MRFAALEKFIWWNHGKLAYSILGSEKNRVEIYVLFVKID